MSSSISPKLRFLLDIGPLGVFFIAYRLGGTFAATAALIAATLLSLTVIFAYERKIAPMPLITGILVTFMGGLTLYLQNEQFIKMKPTFVNLAFALVLLVGQYGYKKPLLKPLLGAAFPMTDKGWWILSRRWALFFIFLAALNEYIWRNFSTDFWVDFKVFGMFALTLAFTFSQIPLMKREGVEEKAAE